MVFNDSRLEHLAHDHDRIRAASHELSALITLDRMATARDQLADFATLLRAHMATEEASVLAALAPVPEFTPSVARLRREHDQMRAALTWAEASPDDPTWSGVVGNLLHQFALHEIEEEEDLFRAAEVVLPFPGDLQAPEPFPASPSDEPAGRPAHFPEASDPCK